MQNMEGRSKHELSKHARMPPPRSQGNGDGSGFTDRSNYEHKRSRIFMDEERRREHKNSRPTPVDPRNYAKDSLASETATSLGLRITNAA